MVTVRFLLEEVNTVDTVEFVFSDSSVIEVECDLSYCITGPVAWDAIVAKFNESNIDYSNLNGTYSRGYFQGDVVGDTLPLSIKFPTHPDDMYHAFNHRLCYHNGTEL